MSKRYVYKNVNNQAINIGGYQFEEGQELESDVLINGFNEAVTNGFLELTERKPEGTEPDATQAPQTGDTGKVKVIWHMIFAIDGMEVLREAKVDPGTLVDFPVNKLSDGENIKGWFKDSEFTKPVVNVDKAKAPKEGEIHFYGKYEVLKEKEDDVPPVNPNPNDPVTPNNGTGSTEVTLPPLPPPPIPTVEGEAATTDSEDK